MIKNILFTAVFILSIKTFACLNDTAILPDGRWSYSGAFTGPRWADNEKIIVAISTDSTTNKRYIEIEGVRDDYQGGFKKYEITQCSAPYKGHDSYRYFVNFRNHDQAHDIYEILSASIEVVNGTLIANPNSGCLYERARYYQYSKKGMGPDNVALSACFSPGYHISQPPRYDSNGRIDPQWYGAQPVRLM